MLAFKVVLEVILKRKIFLRIHFLRKLSEIKFFQSLFAELLFD